MNRIRFRLRRAVAILALLAAGIVTVGCNAARILLPNPLRAASVNAFAVEVEFGEPLERASAEDPARYDLHPSASPGSRAVIYSATVVDTLYGRVVQLLIASGPLPDREAWEITTSGVRTDQGRSTGTRTASFVTGLGYASDMRTLFAEHCDRCHGATLAEGNYRTDSLAYLRGVGTDATPNLIAGDPGCRLVRRTLPGKTMFDQGGLSVLESGMIRDWIVEYGARP